MYMLWTSKDAFAILPLYFLFLCGLAQGRLFRSLPGRSSFATEKACRFYEASWYHLSAESVHPAPRTVTPSYKGTTAWWCIFRLPARYRRWLGLADSG